MYVVDSVFSVYYCGMTRIFPLLRENLCHIVCSSFLLGLCLDGDFSLNLLWNPQQNNIVPELFAEITDIFTSFVFIFLILVITSVLKAVCNSLSFAGALSSSMFFCL